MRRFNFVFFSLILCCSSVSSQDIQDAAFYNSFPKNFTKLKLSLLDMVNPFSPALVFGVEHRVADLITVSFSGGAVNSFDGEWANDMPMRGYLFRLEGRRYLQRGFRAKMYFGWQGLYKQTKEEDHVEDFSRFNNSYFEELEFSIKRESIAAHITWGYHYMPNDNFTFDVGLGFGVRNFVKTAEGIPEDAELADAFGTIFLIDFGDHYFPSAFFNVSLGFSLDKFLRKRK